MLSRVYFAYGSNLWVAQMNTRCPNSIKIGVAKLSGFRWVISKRGYANIHPSADHDVYGVLYVLSPSDEATLDRFEGVPRSYLKTELEVVVEVGDEKKVHPVLVYVDPRRGTGPPKQEYIQRMRAGLQDANLPAQWTRENIEPWLQQE